MNTPSRPPPKAFIKNHRLAAALAEMAERETELAEQTRRFKAANDGLERFLRTGVSATKVLP